MQTVPLSTITAEPGRYQFRRTPFSPATVDGIVAEGINPSKFDPLPLIKSGTEHVVGGDGHSRHEAIRRLAETGDLPATWRAARDWRIPAKLVTVEEARRLAWTANLSRDDLKPAEEARVYQSMIDDGLEVVEVGRMVHKSPSHVQKILHINNLARDIQDAIGRTGDAGGVDKHIACTMGDWFARYGISKTAQQQLWHSTLKHADLTNNLAREIIKRIGAELQGSPARAQLALLFDPAEYEQEATAALERVKARGQNTRRATRGLAWLLQAKREGPDVFNPTPKLRAFLEEEGDAMLAALKDTDARDADLIGQVALTGKATS